MFICPLVLLYCWSPLCFPSSPPSPHPGRGRTLRRGVQGCVMCITSCSILTTDDFGNPIVQYRIHSKRVTRRQRRLPPISHSFLFLFQTNSEVNNMSLDILVILLANLFVYRCNKNDFCSALTPKTAFSAIGTQQSYTDSI